MMNSVMKIYLDNCSLQRPLDSRTSTRIALEAEAVLGVLALLESGKIQLISSEVLLFEIERDPDNMRQEYALEVLSKAQTFIRVTERVEKRAARYVRLGIKPLDALHVASAEEAKASYFCTCDDRLLRKVKGMASLKVRVISLIELIQELES